MKVELLTFQPLIIEPYYVPGTELGDRDILVNRRCTMLNWSLQVGIQI